MEALYAELPEIECKKRCTLACGPIMMSRWEFERIGKPGPVGEDALCPLLTVEGECSVYEKRPMICRLWGLTRLMRCPHGCTPSRWLTEIETFGFLERARQIGGSDHNGTSTPETLAMALASRR
jgi:hypothetical protein